MGAVRLQRKSLPVSATITLVPQGLWVIAFSIENVSLELLYISSRKISGFLKIYSNDIDGVSRGFENNAAIFCFVLSGFRC